VLLAQSAIPSSWSEQQQEQQSSLLNFMSWMKISPSGTDLAFGIVLVPTANVQ
jgi:hypothetical protein